MASFKRDLARVRQIDKDDAGFAKLAALPAGVLTRTLGDSISSIPFSANDLGNKQVYDCQILDLQKDIGQLCSGQRAGLPGAANWQREWEPLLSSEKERFLVRALIRTYDTTDLCDARAQCFDYGNLTFLMGNGNFVWLVKEVEASNGALSPRRLASEQFTKLFTAMGAFKEHGLGDWLIMRRTMFMSYVVWNVLCDIYGIKEKHFPVERPRSEQKKDKEKVEELVAKHPEMKELAERELNEHQKLTKSIREESHHCLGPSCGSSASKLKSCSKCLEALHRGVNRAPAPMYCSRVCQVAHWKAGHKLECGDKQKEAPSCYDDGTPHSPFLVHQLKRLSESPECDYILIGLGSEFDFGVYLSSWMGKTLFKLSFNRAIKERNSKRSVYMMYQFLENQGGLTKVQIREQLKMEYGFDPLEGKGGAPDNSFDINDVTEAMQSL